MNTQPDNKYKVGDIIIVEDEPMKISKTMFNNSMIDSKNMWFYVLVSENGTSTTPISEKELQNRSKRSYIFVQLVKEWQLWGTLHTADGSALEFNTLLEMVLKELKMWHGEDNVPEQPQGMGRTEYLMKIMNLYTAGYKIIQADSLYEARHNLPEVRPASYLSFL